MKEGKGLHIVGLEMEDGVCRVFILLAYLRAEGSVTPNEGKVTRGDMPTKASSKNARLAPNFLHKKLEFLLLRGVGCVYRIVTWSQVCSHKSSTVRGVADISHIPTLPSLASVHGYGSENAPNHLRKSITNCQAFFLFVQILPCPFSILALFLLSLSNLPSMLQFDRNCARNLVVGT
ncbi:hypothetical protein F5X96DRAFT_344383 [Biscogniauxia mediterranea]|nr:hypothetical protein F5X96DRAFT_344383 [Biscogniauxia mediterranea]